MRTDNEGNVLLRFFIVLGLCLGLPALVDARVSGQCSKCHTMHSSQDGTSATQIFIGANAGWSGGVLVSDAAGGLPQPHLLKSDCVGCHSSTGGENIVDGVPIVWNIGGGQTKDLAAGNFSYVAANEKMGHNVKGVSTAGDTFLDTAPGQKNAGCANSCHVSLFAENTSDTLTGDTGCQGCHLTVGHHDDESNDGGPLDGGGDAYRFLSGHGLVGIVDNNAAIAGSGNYYEDPDWQDTTAAGDFNLYATQDAVEGNDPDYLSIGRFCSGCHDAFHAGGGAGVADPLSGEVNQAASGAWLRHPTNVSIPNAGEFTGLIGQAYDPEMPVARFITLRGDAISADDQVMCLSCHKAHASAVEDLLRFSYSATSSDAHSGAGRTTGCFYCHRTKDD